MSWNFRDVTLHRLVISDVATQPTSPIFKFQVVQGWDFSTVCDLWLHTSRIKLKPAPSKNDFTEAGLIWRRARVELLNCWIWDRSRNVGNYQSTLCNIPEERRLTLQCGKSPKLLSGTSSYPEIIGNFIRWSSSIMCQVMCNYRVSNELNASTFRLQF